MIHQHSIGAALIAFVIGLPAAFFTIALPAQMRDGGASLTEIGLVYIIWLPSALKWIWAPWLEQFAVTAKPRRQLISLLTLMLGTAFLLVAPLTEKLETTLLITLAALCAAISLSLQLLYSGWAIRHLDENSHGKVNGFAAAGMVFGGIVGGGVLPWAANQTGWWTAIFSTCAVIIIAGQTGCLLKDKANINMAPKSSTLWEGINVLRNGPLIICLLLIASASGGDVILPARLIDAGVSPQKTGILLGSLAMLLIVPASIISGWLVTKSGTVRCILYCTLCKGSLLLALAHVSDTATSQIIILSIFDFVFAGALTVLTWQYYMGKTHTSAPVATYAAITSLDALVRFISAMLAGVVAEKMGYFTLFIITATITVCAGMAITWFARRTTDSLPTFKQSL